jgi:hypothetical protein
MQVAVGRSKSKAERLRLTMGMGMRLNCLYIIGGLVLGGFVNGGGMGGIHDAVVGDGCARSDERERERGLHA